MPPGRKLLNLSSRRCVLLIGCTRVVPSSGGMLERHVASIKSSEFMDIYYAPLMTINPVQIWNSKCSYPTFQHTPCAQDHVWPGEFSDATGRNQLSLHGRGGCGLGSSSLAVQSNVSSSILCLPVQTVPTKLTTTARQVKFFWCGPNWYQVVLETIWTVVLES